MGTTALALAVIAIVIGAFGYAFMVNRPPNTGRCVTTNNSIGCATTNDGGTVGSSCRILQLGRGLYIRTVTDSGKPLSDTPIGIYYASPICPGITMDVTAQLLWTNASGWANYNLNGAGAYKFTVQYASQQYGFGAVEKANQTTYVTVWLPSGNSTTAYS